MAAKKTPSEAYYDLGTALYDAHKTAFRLGWLLRTGQPTPETEQLGRRFQEQMDRVRDLDGAPE